MEKKVDMRVIGEKLRKLRGLRTRSGVSRETGIPYSTLQAYECGTREPAGHIKKKLADYYGVTVDELFFADEYSKKE